MPGSCPAAAWPRTPGPSQRSYRRTGRGPGGRPSQPAPSGRATAATVTADAAASASRALGGHGLISTAGGYAAQLAHQEGATPVLLARAAAGAKAAGGLLALALVRPWGRVIPRRWLLAGSAGG